MTMPAEVEKTLRNRCQELHNQIRQADILSKPVAPGHWRWADTKYGGTVRKNEEELAAGRERNRRLAVTLRRELAQVEEYLKAALTT
jgi:hypothetical protein